MRAALVLVCAAAHAAGALLAERYTYELFADTFVGKAKSGLSLTVDVLEQPPPVHSPSSTTTTRFLELVVHDLYSLMRDGPGRIARARLPPETQEAFLHPFWVEVNALGFVQDAIYAEGEQVSVLQIKRALVGSLFASMPQAPDALLEALQSSSASQQMTWVADEADHTGVLQPVYTAIAVEDSAAAAANASSSSSSFPASSRRLLRLTRDVTHDRYRDQYSALESTLNNGRPSGSMFSAAGGSIGPGGAPTVQLLHTAEYLLQPLRRTGRPGSGADVSGSSAGGGEADDVPHLLLGRILSVRHTAVASMTAPGEDLLSGAAATTGDASGGMPDVVNGGASRYGPRRTGQVQRNSSQSIGASAAMIQHGVEAHLEWVSTSEVPYICTGSYARRLRHAAQVEPHWCSELVDDDGLVGSESDAGLYMDPDFQLLSDSGRRIAFNGPRMLHQLVGRRCDSSDAGEPSDSRGGTGYGGDRKGRNNPSSRRRRLMQMSDGRRFVREPFTPLPGQTGKKSDATSTDEKRHFGDSSADRRQLLGSFDNGGAPSAASPPPSPLDLVFEGIRCFPPSFHDDSVPRSTVLEVDVTPCVGLFNNATRLQPSTLTAMHALLLTDPCSAATLPTGKTAERLTSLLGGSSLEPHPCDDVIPQAAESGAARPYLDTRLSDRMVDVLVSAITGAGGSTSSPVLDVAQGIVAHMLTRPHAYRYTTILEHALESLVVVQLPSPIILHALWEVIYGFHLMDSTNELQGGNFMHESQLKSHASLLLAGLLQRHKISTATVASRRMQSDSNTDTERDDTGSNEAASVADIEAKFVDFLYREHNRMSVVMDRRRRITEMVSEGVATLWELSSEEVRMHWRARCRHFSRRDAEKAWVVANLTHTERVAWDAEAIVAWTETVVEAGSDQPDVLASFTTDVAHRATLSVAAAAPLSSPSTAGSLRRLQALADHTSAYVSNASSVQAAVHASARRLFAAETHTTDTYRRALMATATIIHVLGNLGSSDHLGLLLDYTLHSHPEVRTPAIEALRSLPADAPLPPKHAQLADHARRLRLTSSSSSDGNAASRDVFSGIDASVHHAFSSTPPRRRLWDGMHPYDLPAAAHALSSSATARLERLHARHRLTSVFGARVLTPVDHTGADGPFSSCGGPDDGGHDLESHLLTLLSGADVPIDNKVAAVDVLMGLRPLRPCTIDFLLHLYSSQLSHIQAGYHKDFCIAQCVSRKAECRVIPHSRCKADCNMQCEHEHQLAANIGALLDGRLRKERRMSSAEAVRRALKDVTATGAGAGNNAADDSAFSHVNTAVNSNPALRAAASRLRSLPREAAVVPSGGGAAGEASSGRAPRVLLSHEAAAVLQAAEFSRTAAARGRSLWSVDVTTPSAVEQGEVDPSALRQKQASQGSHSRPNFHTHDGYAPSRLLYNARRLGPLTLFDSELASEIALRALIDMAFHLTSPYLLNLNVFLILLRSCIAVSLGTNYGWLQTYGDPATNGASIVLSLANSVSIRVGAFDGFFRCVGGTWRTFFGVTLHDTIYISILYFHRQTVAYNSVIFRCRVDFDNLFQLDAAIAGYPFTIIKACVSINILVRMIVFLIPI